MGPCRNQVGFFGCFFFGRESVVCLALGGGGGGVQKQQQQHITHSGATEPLHWFAQDPVEMIPQ